MRKHIICLSAAVLFSACATGPKAPSFVVTDNPKQKNVYEVRVDRNWANASGISDLVWVQTKATLYAQSLGCTHYRHISSDAVYQRSATHVFTGTAGTSFWQIYECVDANNIENVTTSGDTITVVDLSLIHI